MTMREMSIEEIFQEELESIVEMAAQIRLAQKTLDPFSKEYFLLQNDGVMLEQTAVYLQRRITGTIPPEYMR
jgi:hypothetical protein